MDKARITKNRCLAPETGRIDDLDIPSTDVNALIDKQTVPEKMNILGEMAKRTTIPTAKMIEHIRRKMPSTPWIAGAVAAPNGGFTFQFENIKIGASGRFQFLSNFQWCRNEN